MEPQLPTTPFGRRSLTLAHVASQLVVKTRAPTDAPHKWNIFRAICTAKDRLALTERALAVLDALLSFHPETVLTGDNLIVFPSNDQLSLRAHGMPVSTLRRHLAALVDTGLIIRRDSPNGKRYARKGRDGAIANAFGFDLAPLVARAAEFEALAEDVRAKEQELRCLRERITLARRDVAKMIATGILEGVPIAPDAQGPRTWTDLHSRYREIVARIPRTADVVDLQPIADQLATLAADILILLESHVKSTNSSGNESQVERHIQNSNPESLIEFEPAPENTPTAAPQPQDFAPTSAPVPALPLATVLHACPDIAEYAKGGISSWRDFVATANVVRSALGVTPSAWEAALRVMGEISAAIIIAALLQRGAAITSAGGYLRELTRKAQSNEFSIAPMLMALIRARNRERKCT